MRMIEMREDGEGIGTSQHLLAPVYAPPEQTCLQKFCCVIRLGVCLESHCFSLQK